jgi:Ni/Co efflux regulator RcnB
MKTLLTVAIAVSVLASASMANAQGPGPGHNDKGHQSQGPERHDDKQNGDRRDGDQRAAKRYKAPSSYKRPSGYQQRQWHRGDKLPASYRGKAYVVDHKRYGLNAPPRGYQYVRVDNDVVLTAIATGVVSSVILQLFQ